LTADDEHSLLALAEASLRCGCAEGRPLAVEVAAAPPKLRTLAATFVTLRRGDALRGCVGSCQPYRPLARDVAENAFRAGFRDPRFAPLGADELPGLTTSISVLSRTVRLAVRDEAELLAQLRPGVDGLILSYGPHRGLFLPSVWREAPDPLTFVRLLKRKAGLDPDYWDPEFQALRFTAHSFGRVIGAQSP
jgi:AmmeMemoRadiSam system protein A